MTEQSTTEQQGVATAIVVDGGRVLMIRRREREGKLLWAFPGGGIEAGGAGAGCGPGDRRGSPAGCQGRPCAGRADPPEHWPAHNLRGVRADLRHCGHR